MAAFRLFHFLKVRLFPYLLELNIFFQTVIVSSHLKLGNGVYTPQRSESMVVFSNSTKSFSHLNLVI